MLFQEQREHVTQISTPSEDPLYMHFKGKWQENSESIAHQEMVN